MKQQIGNRGGVPTKEMEGRLIQKEEQGLDVEHVISKLFYKASMNHIILCLPKFIYNNHKCM